jgi:hypothetical protein
MRLKLFGLGMATVLISGCASTYKDFKTSQVQNDQGVAIGRVHVMYNGRESNKNCAICFDSVNGPCQKLTPEGFVFQNIKRGEASLRRVVCKDISLQHFNIESATFKQSPDVTYFGDIDINWTNRGGFKVTDLFGAIGAIISESSNDGAVKISAKAADVNEVLRAYKEQTKESDVHVVSDILKPSPMKN